MNRRSFLSSLAIAPAALRAQQGPPREERVESLTAPAKPAIAMNHLGFPPKGRKTLIYRLTGGEAPEEFLFRDIGQPPAPFQMRRPLKRVSSDFGDCLAGDFSDIDREAMYQVTAGAERSVPFFIRPDLWRRTLPRAVGYYRYQRCGVEVPGVHPVCHLDDARRRDNGERVDTVGGWHDAGDLRKWMSATMMNGIALIALARNLGEKWDLAGSGLAPLLEETQWGNRYFLKMQDADGRVFADVGGGLNGDNSDNHWTDNLAGTSDDRYLNPSKSGRIQAMFVALEAMAAEAWRGRDNAYSKRCLEAAQRCWNANTRGGGTLDLAWWLLAGVELNRAAPDQAVERAAIELGAQLLSLQVADFAGAQKLIRGFWRADGNSPEPYSQAVDSALPALALLELAKALPNHPDAARWRDAVRLHFDEYVLPMSARSAYRIIPVGVYYGAPTSEHYRPLEGRMSYRYFLPVRKQFWWVGTTSHLECYALALATAAKMFGKTEYRDLAWRQLEWVMGANPFAACLMTGEGMRHPYPHSRYVGLIPGGILNGIAGNVNDEPVLDIEYGYDWRTTEYWSPHNAYYIWALSVLES